jgi:hypothetical protein
MLIEDTLDNPTAGAVTWPEAVWQDGPNGGRWVSSTMRVLVPGAQSESIGSMEDLYRKATRAQWDAEADLDWTHQLDERNPLKMPDGTHPLSMSDVWQKMDEEGRTTLRRHMQAWHISQILHGERASFLCASKVMLSATDPAVKACASMQAVDEQRHIEVYSRLLDKLGVRYEVAPNLDRLLYEILETSDPDITALGMQIMIEGLALAFFKSLQSYSQDPLVKKLLELVVRDEARHFAGGQLSLAHNHAELDSAELKRREEFVVHACLLLHEYLFADEIWEHLGLPKAECAALVRSSAVTAGMHRMLFRHLVPAVRGIGLLGPEAQRAFASIGVLDYAAFPV